ncbi:hypothetical protein [Pseudoxanthomonas wuyuanensis]
MKRVPVWSVAILLAATIAGSCIAAQNLRNAPCAWPNNYASCNQGTAYQAATRQTLAQELCATWAGGVANDFTTQGGDSAGNRYLTTWYCYTTSGDLIGEFSQWYGYGARCSSLSPESIPVVPINGFHQCISGCDYSFEKNEDGSGLGNPTGAVCASTLFDLEKNNQCVVPLDLKNELHDSSGDA